MIGKTIGYLTIIAECEEKISKTGKYRYKIYLCSCICGKKVKRYKGTLLKENRFSSCGCRMEEAFKYVGNRNRKAEDPKKCSVKSLFKRSRNHAKHHNRIFDISLERFESISFSPCHYCKSPPTNSYNVYKTKKGRYISLNKDWCDKAEIIVNGLDRMDSNLGYIESNVVPCCTFCNFAKNSRKYEDFIQWLKQVGKVWGSETSNSI